MCSLELPKSVIKQIDKFRKNCLWQGAEINARKPPKAAWKMVCASKEDGGLGVINIRKQNEPLLLKNLHKFFNRMDTPWVSLVWEKHYRNGRLPNHIKKGSFWWRDILKLLPKFKNFTRVNDEDGQSCPFWTDNWAPNAPADAAPELYSFAKNKSISVHTALIAENYSDFFHLPLSQEALTQMQDLVHGMEHMTLTEDRDKWSYIWGSTSFSSSTEN